MPAVPVADIVEFVGGSYSGPPDLVITGVSPLSDAGATELTFLANPKYHAQLATTAAGAILVARDVEGDPRRLIHVDNPYFSMARVVTRWFAGRPRPEGISPLAAISSTARLGADVRVGPFSTIGDDCVIGDRVTIHQGVSIEPGTTIGDDTVIYSNVSIYHATKIGSRCIIHSGVVIGSDGYGFATEGGRHHKIPQIGIVRIGDDVEIGAGTTIDRAALGETVIGEGTKIDNLVQVAHNVKVGRHCLLVSQSGIAGSTELGDYVVVAGQSGFAGHLKIASGTQVAAKTAVLEDLPQRTKVMGTPAIPIREFMKREILSRRLPELFKRLKAVESRLGIETSSEGNE